MEKVFKKSPIYFLSFIIGLSCGMTRISIAPLLAQQSDTIRAPAFTPPTDAQFEILHFKNINKVRYFHDKKSVEKIHELSQNQEWAKLYPLLKKYVSLFGIENFYKDTYMIWRLAKLTETFGDMEEAKALYRLVLKHHRDDIDIGQVELYYDSLNKDYFVPIDYYYELVDFRKEVDSLIPPRGVKKNMGPNINSRRSDYGPSLSYDKSTLLFTSQRNARQAAINELQNEDLFFSRKENDIWQPARPLKGLNSRYNEGSACLSKDGKTIYFARCDAPDGYGNCDIYVAELQADSLWGNVQNLGYNVNGRAWDSHPALSHTEDTLYFASDRIGGFGLSDIYFTYKDKNGEWTPAQNAGPNLNTRNNEVSPFYHPEYNILYYSSNGLLLNFGEFDIYKTYLVAGKWTEPKNIGPLINGAGSEFYFTIDRDSKYLYYAKSAENSLDNLDLYSFPLPMEAQPLATTKVKGSLTDSITGSPFQGIVSIIDLDNGIEITPQFLREDGSFEFDLINNNNYLMVIQGDDYFRVEQMFFLDNDTTISKLTEPLVSRMKFESIEFESGSAELRPEMYSDLDKIVDFLLDNYEFKLRITGHTDSFGDPQFNLELSQRRAEAIREYMVILHPIEAGRVEAKGYGSSMPIIPLERTERDRQINRRVEFEIYRPAKQVEE